MDDDLASIWSHVRELRQSFLRALYVIIVGVAVSFFYYDSIIGFFTDTLTTPLVILSPLEGFLSAMKVCFLVGVVATSPLWIFFFLQFINPALNLREKQLIWPFLGVSFVLITLGFLFAFFITIPAANQYLIAFNQTIGINMWSLGLYLDYTLFLLLANAFAFELGAVGFFLVHLQLISAEQLIAKRRAAIVCSFIIGALLTPPDVLTQIMLAVPLIGLYELIIIYGRFRHRKNCDSS